jgi:fatty acid-binding protein DegV
MSSFAIVADATCDLPESLQKQYNIRVIPGHVVLPDKREILAVPSWDWCSCEEFYRSLKRNPTEYTTSPANVIEFTAVMEEYASRDQAVLIMTISGGISSAYRFALQAKNVVLENIPRHRSNV